MKFKDERSQFIDQMIDNIHNIPVENIVGSRVRLKPNGRHYLGLCPFHKDTKLGSFVVTPDKGMWKCFTCGDGYGGGAIRFMSLYNNTPWLDTAFDIALENGLITAEEREKYGKNLPKAEAVRFEKKHELKEEVVEEVKAPFAIIEKVYLSMKKLSPLKEEHEKHLLNERKLSPSRILADYFTFPNYNKPAMAERIMKDTGVSASDLIHVPGFFYDKKEKKVTYMGSKGIGILIRNADGRVSAIQIRRDVIKEGQSRYHWFSSTFAANDTDKYEGGCGCGSAKDVLLGRGEKLRPILCITEGRFKSEVITANGNDCISLQGVSSWKGIDKEISQITAKKRIKKIFIMFDADMFVNKAVFDQTTGLSKLLSEKFPSIKVFYAVWPKDKGKGIDDLIHSGNVASIRYHDVNTVQNVYSNVYQKELDIRHASSIRDVEDVEKFREAVQVELEKRLCLS